MGGMSIISRLFGKAKSPDPEQHSRTSSAQSSRNLATSQNGARRDVLSLALRETLAVHGIPTVWIAADALSASSRGQQVGIHWRLSIKHWDPRIMLHAVALQHSLFTRVLMLDPLAETWLLGMSWQFALPSEKDCPAMPHPDTWAADPRAPPTVPDTLPGGSADVISGPERIRDFSVDSDLARLMAVRDADFQGNAGSSSTQPMFLPTQPSEP